MNSTRTIHSTPDPFPSEYRLVGVLGSGAFGTVWLADDLNLGIPVALKTVRPAFAPTDARFVSGLQMLRSKAATLARLRHPNVVQVKAWREHGGDHYLVLEYVPGGSFADLLRAGNPLPWDRAARYAADVADGLSAVHARGIVHRDIKPANVLWDNAADEARLTDFGIAAALTGGGMIAGTPAYMAPEAFRGEAGPAVDVYALAATLFHLVAGEPPFRASADGGHLAEVRRGLPVSDPRFAGVPASIEELVRAGLAAEAGHRPPLGTFAANLRGGLNRSLADALVGGQSSFGHRIEVERYEAGVGYVPLAASLPVARRAVRDLKKVPASARRVTARTGDRIRIRVTADRAGYLTVFSIGPTGNMELLLPHAVGDLPVRVAAGEALEVAEAELCPPVGTERVLAVLSRSPNRLDLSRFRGLSDGDETVTRSYRVTRDLKRVQAVVTALPSDECASVALELDHVPADDSPVSG